MTSTLGAGTSFRKRAAPRPKGKISINEKTGEFSYTAAPEDRDDFVVWIQARKGARDEKQKVFVTPHPRLPSEFNVIEHVSKTPPDPASRLYATYAEEDAGEFRFNDIEEIGEGSRAKVMTQKVTASGVRLVLEKKGNGNWLYQKLKDRTTLKEPVLYAGEVVVRCDTTDANGRADGQGSFVRTFAHQKRHNVTLTAPASYGQRAFKGWRTAANTEGTAPEASALNVSKLIEGRALTLDVRAAHDHLVEPVYEPTEFVPVNDRDEKWPACTVGWNFDDWVFVNRTSSELSIEQIIAGATQQEKLTPAVDTPLGTGLVRLSFEHIKLLPGESTKLSVCINPDGKGYRGAAERLVLVAGRGGVQGRLRRGRGTQIPATPFPGEPLGCRRKGVRR